MTSKEHLLVSSRDETPPRNPGEGVSPDMEAPPITRRDFLRGSLALGAGVALGEVPSHALVRKLTEDGRMLKMRNHEASHSHPTITYLSDPTPSDRLCVLVGDGWDPAAPQVQVSLLPDGEPGLPGAALGANKLHWSEAKVVSSAEPQCLTFLLPKGRYGVWAVRTLRGGSVAHPAGEAEGWGLAGEVTLLNRACPEWLSADREEPGATVRAIGRGLVSLNHYPEQTDGDPVSYGGYVQDHGVQVSLRNSGGKFLRAEVVKASSYDVHFRLPEKLPLGDYQVFLHNGHGGPLGWSEPQPLQVVAADPWPTKVFNVRDYGAKGNDNADETTAVQAALDAAGANGGGVVLLPPGKYRFLGSLKIPRRTVLRGADRARVWLYLPQGTDAHGSWGTPEQGMAIKGAFLHGESDFGIENLNILAVYPPLIIAAPLRAELPENPGWGNALGGHAENVFVRNCRLVHEPTYDYHSRRTDDPVLAGEKLTGDSSSKFGRFAAVALQGDHMEVSDCDIKGAGMGVVFSGTRHGLLARNTLRVGSASNCYSLQSSWEKIIIEDNTLTIATNLNHSAARMMGTGRDLYIARNHMEPIFWVCDTEGLHFHLWDSKLTCEVARAGEASVTFDKARLAALRGRCKAEPSYARYVEEEGSLKPGALQGYTAAIAYGRGLGQLRRITDNTADTITVDQPWTVPPQAGSTVALLRLAPFIGMKVIDNIIEEGGSGIHFWGCAHGAILDGNRIYRNGIDVQDLSSRYWPGRDWWEFAGCYFNQMLHNVVASEGRDVAGLAEGARQAELPAVIGAVGFIARDNVVEKDTKLVAQPDRSLPGAFNYLGVVFERNLCRDGAVGIEIGEGVEAVLRDNAFRNVDLPVKGGGTQITRLGDND